MSRENKKTYTLHRLAALILSLIVLLTVPLSVMMPVRVYGSTAETSDEIKVSFLDVGQGDAAVIQCGGKTMMIDGGKPKESSFIYSWLRKNSITKLDYMVATHPDADHIGGLSGALNYASVGTAYCSVTDWTTKTFRNLVKYLKKQGKSLKIPSAGKEFDLGGAEVEVLESGKKGDKEEDDSNNSSIVLKITYGDISFLFTGDAEKEEEDDLLDSDYDLKSTVLKVGHHGSSGSTSYRFLREVDPEYAVISVGADNTYGHPTGAVLSRLRDADVRTYRTDMQGTITAVSDGKSVTFSAEKNPDADTLAGAGAGQKSHTDSGSSGTEGNSESRFTAEASGNDSAGSAGDETRFYAESGSGSGVSASDNSASAAREYVLNTNTMKFHYPDCGSVRQMKDKNKKEVTESRDRLISEGYSPCGRCNP